MSENIISLLNVKKDYLSPNDNTSNNVLNDVSLSVKEGESIAVSGRSGSGKSTLLNLIGTLLRPTSGKIILDNEDITQLSDCELSSIRNKRIGFVFQMHHLLPQCSALENVMLPVLPYFKKDYNAFYEKALYLLEYAGLKDRMNYNPGQLSGGERQRVAFVRALINDPKIILADEPTGSLDNKTSLSLFDLLIKLNSEQNRTLIVVTHSIELASKMAKRYELRDGLLNEI